VIGIAGVAVTLATTAAAVLELLPRVVWIALLVIGIAGFLGALLLHACGKRPASRDDGREGLREQLRGVDGVRTWLGLLEDPSGSLPLAEDRVFEWAKKTYGVMRETVPAEADEFMGKSDAPLGSAHFATAYVLRIEQTGRSEYLETRAGMVREILRSP
jgi:hypothetical protein